MAAKLDGTNGLIQSYDYQTPATGFSYTFAAGNQMLIMKPAATLATGTIITPASPVDGMTIKFTTTQTITALTLTANTGQTVLGGPTTLPANSTASYTYRLSDTTWYPAGTTPAAAASYAGPSATTYTTAGSHTFTIPTGVTKLKVTVVGGGGGAGYVVPCVGIYNGVSGGTSNVASGTQTISTVSATGGAGGSLAFVTGGLGSGGDINARGGGGPSSGSGGGYSSLSFAVPLNSSGTQNGILGAGGAWNGSGGSSGGGGGGTATKWLSGLTPGNTLSVTVGAGGTSGGGGGTGGAGVVIFEY